MLSNKYLIPIFYLVIFVIVAACNSNHDFEKYRAEILNLHKEMINAHLNKDIDFFTENIADDYFSVGGGEINHPELMRSKRGSVII